MIVRDNKMMYLHIMLSVLDLNYRPTLLTQSSLSSVNNEDHQYPPPFLAMY